MIIRSQDKRIIVNLDNLDTVSVDSDNAINTYNGIINTRSTIAIYSTEERAIKVLDMIQNAYTQYGTIKDGLGSIHGAFNIPKCFQMPSDDEVEV